MTIQSGFAVECAIKVFSNDGTKSEARATLPLSYTKLVEAGNQTGYLTWMARALDCEKR